MTRFDRYVLGIFIKYTIIVQAFIMIVTMFTSALSHLQGLQKYGVTLMQMVKLEVITLPMGINSALPITMVVSSIVTVMLLMRSRELLAYASLGGRIQRFLVPFVGAAVLTAAFMILFDHNVYPKVRVAQQRYLTEVIKKEPFIYQNRLVDLWIMDNGTQLVNIGLLDMLDNNIRDITLYELDENFQVSAIRTIPRAVNQGDDWILYNVRIADVTQIPPAVHTEREIVTESKLLDDLTSISSRSPRQLSPGELSQIISVMKARGLGTVKYEMLLASKYANALSVIVLVILVVPIGVDFSRRYSPIKSAALSFSFGIAFWAMLAAFSSLGTSGIFSPKVANYFPHVFFLIVGLGLLWWREKAR